MRLSGNKIVYAISSTVLAAAVVLFAWNVIGVSVEPGLARQIASARSTWNAKNSGSYRAVVRVIDYNRPARGDVTVEVRNGSLIEATSNGIALPADEAANTTIEALFDYAASQVADLPDLYITTGNGYRYTLHINPDLGYIEEFKMDICGRGPSQVTGALECRWGFDVLDVRLGE